MLVSNTSATRIKAFLHAKRKSGMLKRLLKAEMNHAISGSLVFFGNFSCDVELRLLFSFRQVLDIVATVRNENPEELSETILANTETVFFKK